MFPVKTISHVTVPCFLNTTFIHGNLKSLEAVFFPSCRKLQNYNFPIVTSLIPSSQVFLWHEHSVQKVFITHLCLYNHPMRSARQVVLFLFHKWENRGSKRFKCLVQIHMESKRDSCLLRPAFLISFCYYPADCPTCIILSLKTPVSDILEYYQSKS